MKTKLLLLITLSIGLIANCSSSQKYELVKQKSNLNHVVLRNAQFFQDEKFALVNSDLIDLEKKAIVRSFKNTNALFLTKDNKTIIAPILNFSGQKEGGFEFYDVSTGKQIKRNTQEFFTSGALSQASITDNGKYLIGHKYSVEIYELKSLDLHPKSWVMTDDNTKRKFYRQDISIPLCPCRIFSDREFFAYYIYGKERKIVKVDIESGEFYPILNFKNGTELIQLSVSDDKRILAVVLKNSSLENELILFDTTTSKIQKSIFVKKWTDDASAKYFNIVFSPNNEQFIYGNKLYSTSDGTIIREFEYDMENPYFLKKKNEVVFSPILTNSNNMNALVQYMNLDTGKEIIEKRINQFSSQTSKIQYDKESKSFVVLNNTNSLRYDFRNNKVIKINAFVNAVTRYSPHNKKAFTLDEKGLHILDLNTLQTEIISDKLEQIIKILNETKSPLLDKTLGTPINSSDFIEHSDSLDGRYIVTYWRPWPGLKILKYFVWDMTNKSVYIGSFDNKIKSDELFWILGIHDNGDLIGAINSKLFTVNHKSFEITKTYNYQCRIWPTKIIFLDKDSFLSQGNALVIPSQPIIFHPLCNGLTPKILIFNFKENIITQAFTMPEKDSVFQLKRANDPSSIGGIGQNSYFLWDVKSGKIKKHFERVKDIMDFDSLGEMQLVLEADGSTELGNDSNNMKLSIVPTSNSDLLISNDKNQYMVVGKEGYNAFQFSKGLETYSFELFDISNNRPDIILNSLAELTNDESLKPRAAYYKKLWQIRVKQNGYSPEKLENQGEVHFPEAKITEKPESPTTTQKKISFSFRLKDDESTSLPIVGYKVFVNGVPIYGDYIRRVTPDGSVINNSSVTIQEKIDLSQGVNKIEVSGFTSDGHESPRDSFTINYNSTEQRVPDLYYIGIGVNAYDANKSGGLDALTYAVKDSQELKDTFEKSGKGKICKCIHESIE
jgi:hypothetical protein